MNTRPVLFLISLGFLLVSIIPHTGCTAKRSPRSNRVVQPGIERLFTEHVDKLRGKRVGLVVNHTSVDTDGRHLVDRLDALENVHVEAIFAPEHGYRGNRAAGEQVEGGRDPSTGARVYSLYGDLREPDPRMMQNLDLILYDIQDVGARFYTYISTMGYAMRAAAENNMPFVVLDRPNPITGTRVAGPITEPDFQSFVGRYPIPIRYGMTPGELARMIAGEQWLDVPESYQPTVVKMNGWKRDLWMDETGINWIAPSPNMPRLKTATLYPGLCLIEGTNVSEGRGTDHPFEWIGAPWIDGQRLANRLNAMNQTGVRFEPVTFTPRTMEGRANNPKYEGRTCQGVRIRIENRTRFQPVRTGVAILWMIHDLYGNKFAWRKTHIDRLYGSDTLRKHIEAGASVENLIRSWKKKEQSFREQRKPYLLY